MCSDKSYLHDTQQFLQAYFEKTFECWVENYNLPRKLLAKVDERKLPCMCTAMGVIDGKFFNALYEITKTGGKCSIAVDTGTVQFQEFDGGKVSVFKVDFHHNSVLREFTNGMPSIHLGLSATEAYSFERSVYGFWLHDLDDNDLELFFDVEELEKVAANLKSNVAQKLFFDGEAKKRWDAAAEYERYAAVGRWAAEQDVQ